MRKNVLAAAIAGAMALGSGFTQAMRGAINSVVKAGTSPVYHSPPPRPSRSGHTVAQGKRNALKFRNRLRNKGQFRKAVR